MIPVLALQEVEDVLAQEIERCETLLDSEPDRSKCKWPMLTLARLLELQASLSGQSVSNAMQHNI
jgi:hypothetical protein